MPLVKPADQISLLSRWIEAIEGPRLGPGSGATACRRFATSLARRIGTRYHPHAPPARVDQAPRFLKPPAPHKADGHKAEASSRRAVFLRAPIVHLTLRLDFRARTDPQSGARTT